MRRKAVASDSRKKTACHAVNGGGVAAKRSVSTRFLDLVGIDRTEQPAFVIDTWNIRRVEDEQQQA